jgi:methyltransferase-like protein
MEFSHCDKDEKYLSLHDCVVEKAYFQNGKLGFEFNNGFWITPDHPESNLSEIVRTDFSKVEYDLEDGEDYDATVYVFKETINKTIRTEWKIQKLVDKINNGKCKLEFLYQYINGISRIIECELVFNRQPYRIECLMKISALEVSYYWNNLREDRPW